MPIDPSLFYGPTLYPQPGWLRVANLNGAVVVPHQFHIAADGDFRYSRKALTPVSGYKQQTVHSRGKTEINITMAGDLTVEGKGILNFLDPSFRGVIFPISILQGTELEYLESCYLKSLQLNGIAGQPVKFQLEAVSLTPPVPTSSLSLANYQHPVPSWASGNSMMDYWTIQHSIELSPTWWNNQNPLPAYYRPGFADLSFNYTLYNGFANYDAIQLGMGSLSLTAGVATSRSINGDGDGPKTYDVTLKSVSVNDDPFVTPSTLLINLLPQFSGYPDGI